MKKLKAYLKAERGRQSALALSLGIEPAAVAQWPHVPAHHCLAVEKITGVSRYDLRPDIYGKKGAA